MNELIGSTVYWLVGGLFLFGLFGVPLLRAAAMMITGVVAAVRSIEGWVKIRPLGAGKERPLHLEGLTPGLADITRQTRFLTLELRRHSEQAPTWPEAPADGKQGWWDALVGVGGFEPHTEATREAWEWVRALERLPAADRERVAGLGVRPEPIRELLGAELGPAAQVRALCGVLESFDERLADLSPAGYRGANAYHSLPPAAHTAPPRLVAGGDGTASDARPRGDLADDDEAALRERRRRWAEVLEEHGPGLSRIAASHARGRSEREDLEQDISLALWQALPAFRGESSLRTFVYRVARYCCYRILRRRGRLDVDEYTDEVGDPSACIESWMARADEHAQLERALARLPEGPRSTLALRLEGKSYAEIAGILGISERNVSVRLVRARERIAAELRAAA
ncbi:MAG: sigma-70 family RNA polymerase sigma factor [Nannocystaceae bacterium]